MIRIGHGYDVHRLCENRKLIIGGVEIPYEKGLLGHSDADVLLHAISDALLGAAALGDIGCIFPDNDEKYKDADSLVLLSQVVDLLKEVILLLPKRSITCLISCWKRIIRIINMFWKISLKIYELACISSCEISK